MDAVTQILLLESVYAFFIVIPAILVYLLTGKLYHFSHYKGISYFRNSFLFIAIGFLLRYLVMLTKIFSGNLLLTIDRFGILTSMMELFLILPGFFLLYSLIWKRSKILLPVLIFGAITIVIVDFILQTLILMYISQMIAFFIAGIISLVHYSRNKNKIRFMYFVSMVLFLIVWTINLIAQATIEGLPIIRLYAYLITVVAVFLFLYMTIKLTSDF